MQRQADRSKGKKPRQGQEEEDSIHQELESLAGTALDREMTEGEADIQLSRGWGLSSAMPLGWGGESVQTQEKGKGAGAKGSLVSDQDHGPSSGSLQ